MNRLFLFLFALPLLATNYYVANASSTPAGSDSNDGSIGAPWLTLQYAVNQMGCGDTVNVVADGRVVAGDATLPALPTCGQTTTIQSSKISTFSPVGYRTKQASDQYGKLTLSTVGITLGAETRGFDQTYIPACAFTIASSTFTLSCTYGMWNLVNGSQIEFDPGPYYSAGWHPQLAPGGLSYLTHYYVVNSSCATPGAVCPNGTTFQVSATSGGSPITIGACDAYCLAQAQVVEPVAVNTSTSTLTVPRPFVNIGSTAAFSAVALASSGYAVYGTLPAPLQKDVTYYVINLDMAKQNFQLAATPGGSPITLTTPGTGLVSIANTNVPHDWALRGLELYHPGNAPAGYLISIGVAGETSIYGMVHNIELDRLYMHGDDLAGNYNSLSRCIFQNGQRVYIHDSVCTGATYSEAQAILSCGSDGPVAFVNNFFEAMSEDTMAGGCWSAWGGPNQHQQIIRNYYYRPPLWKATSGSGAPSNPCWWDNTDPLRTGGEFYRDTAGSQSYICGSNFQWSMTAASLPTLVPFSKDLAEHKNGRDILYYGNLLNYSWVNGQLGQVFNNSNLAGSGPGFANDNIVVQNNFALNFWEFANVRSDCDATTYLPCPIYPSRHATINNLGLISPSACGVAGVAGTCPYPPYQGSYLQAATTYALQGDERSHNTFWSPDSLPHAGIGPMGGNSPTGGCTFPAQINLGVFVNNIGRGDFNGDCSGVGTPMLLLYYSNSTFDHNAFVGLTGTYATAGSNTWTNIAAPANNAALKLVSATGLLTDDYHVDPTSNYSAANSMATLLSNDGTDLGADIDLIKMATSGAAAGTPPWDQMYNVHWSVIGSTKAVLSYTAPTSAACTATIYSTPVRNLVGGGNIVATVLDSAASSISDGLRREILVTGLTASTQYWWKLSCAGGVLILDPNGFKTHAASGTLQFPFQMSSATALVYSVNKDLSSGTTLSAATTQYVPVTTNATIYSQFSGGQLHVSVAP